MRTEREQVAAAAIRAWCDENGVKVPDKEIDDLAREIAWVVEPGGFCSTVGISLADMVETGVRAWRGTTRS